MHDQPLELIDDEMPLSSTDSRSNQWKILVVDDAEEVHIVTKLVLTGFVYENRGIRLLNAYTAAEALGIMKEEDDIALILLDVVMETDSAGLDLAKEIRETLGNKLVRIVLRTGQPGMAPERDVILNYDINDYKDKTELTSQKLISSVVTSLRDYQRIQTIDRSRRGLGRIVRASKDLFQTKNLVDFVNGALTQLAGLLGDDDDSLYVTTEGLAAIGEASSYTVLAATGAFEHLTMARLAELPPDVSAALQCLDGDQDLLFQGNSIAATYRPSAKERYYLYIRTNRSPLEIERELVRIFSSNIAAAFENLSLHQEIVETQLDVINTLGELLESRSRETANHVRRVGEYAKTLGALMGMSADQTELLRFAAPMHDIGKIGISDAILSKPESLSESERGIVETHTIIGSRILSKSERPLIKTARIIAAEHHERWDGKGYPYKLKGGEISIHGRICAIADVFDALLCRRPYKEAWTTDAAIDFIRRNRGTMFDPEMVDVFVEHAQDFIDILHRLPDIDTNEDPRLH